MADYNNGSVTVTVTGGQAPYTYTLLQLVGSNYEIVPDNQYTSDNWQNPANNISSTQYTFGNPLGPDQNTTINETGIEPGTYKVRIVDAGGCELETDPIEVGEFVVGGGSTACVTFETANPPEAPLAWTLEATTPTSSANNNGNITAYIPTSTYNGGFDDTDITVTATLAGGGSYTLSANPSVTGNTYFFNDNPAELVPGTYTVVATVSSAGAECSRSLGTVVIPQFVEQTLDITGVTFSSGGSPVSPSNLVVGTQYTVTVNSTSANLDGAAQFNVLVSGTSNVTVLPSGFSTNNTFTVTINEAGTFTLTVLASDNFDQQPVDTFIQSITVAGIASPCDPFTTANMTAVVTQDEQVLGDADGIITVTIPTISGFTTGGAIVTAAASGQTTVTATHTGSGTYVFNGMAAATWTITAVQGIGSDICTKNIGNVTVAPGAAAPVTMYYFQGGSGAWPYAYPDFINPDPTFGFILPSGAESGTGYNPADLAAAMNFVMDKAISGDTVLDPLGSGGSYSISNQQFPAGTTASTLAETTVNFSNSGFASDLSYIILPTSFGDISGSITESGFTVSVGTNTFTYNGTEYTIYSMGSTDAGDVTIKIN